MTTLSRLRIVLAALYWLFALFVYVGGPYAEPGWAKGGFPLMAVGLPWSITVYLGAILIALIPGIGEIVFRYALATEAGSFFTFVIVCCGLNTVLIAGFSEVFDHWQDSASFRRTMILTLALLIVGMPFVMPMVERDAMERRRPQNIPKTAVGIGGFREWWQQCVYDATRHIDLCQIWNGNGVIIEEGEFVPYNGGPPATTDELQIVDDPRSGLDTVVLQDGRILIPKEQESRRKR